MKKICVITGTRAEYGLLYLILKGMQHNENIQLQLIATGMHLSPEFGLTYKEIESDGFIIDKKIEILLSSDSSVGVSKSVGLAIISFAEAYSEMRPDAIMVLGDRYEIFAAASAAMLARIPIIHLDGGELTEGAIDDAMRHGITKMSHIHLTTAVEHRHRVIQMGEQPEHVITVGSTAIDNIKKLQLLSKKELEHQLNFTFGKRNILITFHPATLDEQSSGEQLDQLLEAIDALKDIKIIFTHPNSDFGSRMIIQKIDAFVRNNSHRSVVFPSLGQLRYLSALQFIDAVVGNSSSGLSEAPSFHIGTINIGSRQKSRLKAESVIDCEPNQRSIIEAFNRLYSESFQHLLKSVINPYGEGASTERILEILENLNIKGILKKKFHNISWQDHSYN